MRKTALLLLIGALAPAAWGSGFDTSYLAAYQGTYRFPDGTCIAGGRMDEAGKSRLLYMDVWRNRLGGLFERHDDAIESLVPSGIRLRFGADGSVMTWAGPDGTERTASRVAQPDSRPAHFTSHGLKLAGRLFVARRGARHLPAVVLAHGSGPVTRFAGPWIDFFTNLGFAVLAYDKRGSGESPGDWRSASYVDLADDLSAAVDWLAGQPEVDATRLGIHSSSQSGWYAPRVAARNPRVRFLIQRAGPGLSVGPVTLHERQSDWRADGVAESDIRPAGRFWMALHTLARRDGSLDEAQHLLDEARTRPWFPATYGDWHTVDTGWWQRVKVNVTLQPARTAARLRIPVLWFLADHDQNVPYAASRAAVDKAAKTPHADIRLITIHGGRHSFLVREADGTVHFTDRYWPVMADWLKARGMTERAFSNCGGPHSDPEVVDLDLPMVRPVE
ncbi:MAG: alpha/beta hydrolase [Gammaproteobacteria bacterium]|jgi:alpha-beta hydrolase superfamily lysophospholipase